MNVPSGYTALDMVGFTDQGVYNSATAYVKNDIVHYNGNLWRCLVDDTTAVTPTEGANWTVFLAEPTSAAEDIIAPVEATATSTRIYSVGDQLILGDVLYDVTQAINIGDTFTVGTNIAAADTIVEQLAEKADSTDLAAVATSGEYSDLNNLPTLGTAAAKNVPSSGDASTTEVVMGNDTRLTNARNAADVPAWAKTPNKPTYNGSEIETSTAKTGTAQQSISDTVAAGTSMDNVVEIMLNNDKTLDTNVTSLKETLTNQITTNGSKNILPMYPRYLTNRGLTVNTKDGYYIINGTATGNPNSYDLLSESNSVTDFKIVNLEQLGIDKTKSYIFTRNFNRLRGQIRLYQDGTQVASFTFDDGGNSYSKEIDFSQYTFNQISARILISQTVSLTNQECKLMLCLKSDYDLDSTWVPYAKTNQLLTKETTGLIDNTKLNGAVNMLPNTAVSQVIEGITWTVNPDGTVIADGTATDTSMLTICSDIRNIVPDGKVVKVSGMPDGGTAPDGSHLYGARFRSGTDSLTYVGPEGYIGTLQRSDSTLTSLFVLRVQSGVTVSNVIFKPMITVVDYDGDYVPYAKSNKELTDKLTELSNDVSKKIIRLAHKACITIKATKSDRVQCKIISGAGECFLSYSGSTWSIFGKVIENRGTTVDWTYSTSGDTIILNCASNFDGILISSESYIEVTQGNSSPQANTIDTLNLYNLVEPTP